MENIEEFLADFCINCLFKLFSHKIFKNIFERLQELTNLYACQYYTDMKSTLVILCVSLSFPNNKFKKYIWNGNIVYC